MALMIDGDSAAINSGTEDRQSIQLGPVVACRSAVKEVRSDFV